MEVIKCRALAEIRELKKWLWECLEVSRTPRETTSQKHVSMPGGVVGEGEAARIQADKERKEVSLKTENRDGNPAFARELIACIDRECRIHGIDAPQKMEVDVIKPIQIIRVVSSRRDEPIPDDLKDSA